MRQLSRGFWLIALLVTVAITAPCVAWYVAGSRAVDQQSDQLREVVRDRGQQIALGLAERLRGRLEAMADAESLRPFYYFQSSYHDPTSSCECDSRSPSPLAVGPTDPFISGYFQIDADRHLTLPLAPQDHPTPEQQALQRELQAAVDECIRAVELITPTSATSRPQGWSPSAASGSGRVDALALDPLLRVDPFQWHGIPLASGPALIALRRVEGSREQLLQGFVLSRRAVQEWLDAAEWPSQLSPVRSDASPAETVAASVPLECTQWEIVVRVDDGLREAETRAAQLRAGFLRNFGLGSIAAWITALALLSVLAWREKSERQRSRFAAAAAHELRTPLTGLRLYAEMLSDPSLSSQQRQKYAAQIAGEAQRLGRVVSNVLEFTQLEHRGVTLDLQPIDLGTEVARILDEVRGPLRSAGAEIVAPSDCPESPCAADPSALGQILRNLIDNAEKYSRMSEDRRIHVELSTTDDESRVEVRDHGPGIDPQIGDRIFRPFQRGQNPTQPSGLGLGLMVATHLAQAQGAELRWTNEATGGARFSLVYPKPT